MAETKGSLICPNFAIKVTVASDAGISHASLGRSHITIESMRGGFREGRMRRPRNAAIDSGTIAVTGDGSTAPSEGLDGSEMGQVGEPAETSRKARSYQPMLSEKASR